jgi:hypothetical protein
VANAANPDLKQNKKGIKEETQRRNTILRKEEKLVKEENLVKEGNLRNIKLTNKANKVKLTKLFYTKCII